MSHQLSILEHISVWSWYIILFTYYWIWYANILFRVFASMIMRDISIQFVLLIISLSDIGSMVMLTLYQQSLFYFLKEFMYTSRKVHMRNHGFNALFKFLNKYRIIHIFHFFPRQIWKITFLRNLSTSSKCLTYWNRVVHYTRSYLCILEYVMMFHFLNSWFGNFIFSWSVLLFKKFFS